MADSTEWDSCCTTCICSSPNFVVVMGARRTAAKKMCLSSVSSANSSISLHNASACGHPTWNNLQWQAQQELGTHGLNSSKSNFLLLNIRFRIVASLFLGPTMQSEMKFRRGILCCDTKLYFRFVNLGSGRSLRGNRWNRCGHPNCGRIPRKIHVCHGQGCRVLLEMGDLPPLTGNPYNGYINPYYWVDDHPLLYGTIGSLDPSTCQNRTQSHTPGRLGEARLRQGMGRTYFLIPLGSVSCFTTFSGFCQRIATWKINTWSI